MRIQIAYVNSALEVELAEESLCFDLSPASTPPISDPDGEIRRALAQPIGTPPLSELVRSRRNVVILGDDNTRPTPARAIIPLVLDELNRAGVPDSSIRVIIASGTHRPMTPDEIDAKYGPPVLSRVPVLGHNYLQAENLVDYGVTRRGTRIVVNRQVVEADVRIGVGNIVPHHPTGWSGGAKIVLPGVGGEKTVAEMHLLGSRDPHLGTVDTAMRQEMEDFAAAIGLDFIVNTVFNRHGELVAAVAGHFVDAHRAGVARAKEVFGAPFSELADLTLASTSPVDFDFFQADKGIFAAELATRPGGEIVLISGCHEGFSPSHSDLAEYGSLEDEEIWARVKSGQGVDPLTAAEALVVNHIKRLFKVTVVSEGFTPAMTHAMGFHHVAPRELGEYVKHRMAESPKLRVGILRHSAEVLPILQARNGA
ncbi:MAG: nickel-dependent lactate racemase [Chloroflexi bacterium]|nr:nickel-dependent lactate racemase [Chloroflexota bacterium]